MPSRPAELGGIDPQLFEHLKRIVPTDAYLHEDYRPEELLTHLPTEPSRELYEVLRPLAGRAIADFEQTQGMPATDVRLHLSHAETQRTAEEHWHQLLLFPDSFLYEAISANGLDFAIGNAPGLNFMPDRIVRGVTRGLIAMGKLQVVTVGPNKLVKSDSYAVRRHRDTIPGDSVVLVSLDVYNGYQSYGALEGSRREKIRAHLLAARD